MFFRQAARYRGRALVHYLHQSTWQVHTWADMRRDVLAVASALVEQGVKAGDHVVLMSENRLEWLYCDLAIQSAGAITVPIYPNVSDDIAQRIATDCEATLAVVSNTEEAAKLRITGPLRAVALMEKEVAEWVARPAGHLVEVNARLTRITPDDICTIVYTSGTTGDPKGAELAHRNLVDICRAAMKVHPVSESDSTLSFLPYAHVFERINCIFLGLMCGFETWISRGADHLTEELAEVQPTIMCSVPRLYEKMYAAVMARVREASAPRQALFLWALRVGTRYAHESTRGRVLTAQHAIADRLVLASLRKRLTGGRLRFFISGGAGLAREIEEFFWAIGVPILNGWGMTETSSGACSNTLYQHRFLTVGKPFPGVELKIAEDGEILVKSPGNMLGYHDNPAATAEMLKDGWIYSGDIGEIDADGFLKITDRKKSMFKTAGGKYIAPLQLEFALARDPLISRSVVIGEGRPYVTALIVPDRDSAAKQRLDEAGLKAHIQKTVDDVNAHLGNWETIKYFTLLPADFTEKSGELSLKLDVKRKVVAQHYEKEIDLMYTGKAKPS
ncbi:MAG: AMP-dependent synthetase/ligase [Candidatus Dormibacteraceae bacterium]